MKGRQPPSPHGANPNPFCAEPLEGRLLLSLVHPATAPVIATDSHPVPLPAPLAVSKPPAITAKPKPLIKRPSVPPVPAPANTIPFPTPLTTITPVGSLVYETKVSGSLASATDTISYSIDLDAGQTVTLLVSPGAGFTPAVTAFDPGGNPIASATASAPSRQFLLQNVPIQTSGTYTFTLSSADAGFGSFVLTLDLNATREKENYDGVSNDTFAGAQDLTSAFTSPTPSLSRAAVLGTFDPVFLADFESGPNGFTVDNTVANGLWHLSTGRATQAGHSANHSFYFGQNETTTGGGNYDIGARTAGYLISPAISLPSNQAVLTLTFNYVLVTDGLYDNGSLQISTDAGAHWNTLPAFFNDAPFWTTALATNLLPYAGKTIMLRWSFDTINAQLNTREGWYIDDVRISGRPADTYAIHLNALDHLTLFANSASAANMTLSLFDPDGNVLATNSSISAGRTALIDQFPINQTGAYYARLSGTTGISYTLLLNQNAASDFEPNDTLATAQDITPTAQVVGSLFSGGTAPIILEDFESSSTLSSAWTTYSSSAGGHVSITTISGTKALFLETPNTASDLSEAIYTVDLTGQKNTTLSFSHFNYADSTNAFNGDFTGHFNADGIAISADGIHWHPIWTAPNQSNVWKNYTVDLAALAAAGNVPLGAGLRIKFQYYMSLGIGGLGWDNISINTPIAGEDYYAMNLQAGEGVILSTITPGDGPFEFPNTLNPVLSIYDSAGNLLGSDDNAAADGKNAQLNLVPATGRYIIKVSAATRDSGDYILQATRNSLLGPPPDQALTLTAASDTGVSDSDQITSDNTPTFEMPPGLPYRIYRNGVRISGPLETTTLYIASPQPDGIYDYTFTTVDAQGNESLPSPALRVTIDTSASAAPAAPDLDAASDSGVSNTDNLTNIATPVLDLSAIEAGVYFRVYRNGVLLSGDFESGGSFTTPPLPDGIAAYTVRAVDAAGNVSPASAPLNVTVITSVQVAIPDLAASSDSGSSKSDNVTNSKSLVFSVPGALNYRLFRDGVEVTSGPTSAPFTESAALPDGSYIYTAIAGDAAGNVSPMSAQLLVTIDTVAPAKPPLPDLAALSDTGISDFDNITGVNTATFDLEVGDGNSYLAYFDGRFTLSSAPAQSFTLSSMDEGVHNLFVIAADLAGNQSPGSDVLTFTIDRTAPKPTTVLEPDPTFAGGSVALDLSGGGTRLHTIIMPDGSSMMLCYIQQSDLSTDFALVHTLANGQPDPHFGVNGVATLHSGLTFSWDLTSGGLVVQSNGKIVVVGSPEFGAGQTGILRIGRFNADGSPDTTFGVGGLKILSFPTAKFNAQSIALQSDDKIVMGGFVATGPDFKNKAVAIARLNADASIDTHFAQNGLYIHDFDPLDIDNVTNVFVLPSGKILASVDAVSTPDFQAIAAIRFNADGLIDSTYGSNGFALFPNREFYTGGAILDSDGRLVLAGAGNLRRFNADGTFDNSFFPVTSPAIAGSSAIDLTQLNNGKYLLVSDRLTVDAPYHDCPLTLFNNDGTIDTNFADAGTTLLRAGAHTPYWVTPAQAPDGDLVINEDYRDGTPGFFLARFKFAPTFHLDLRAESDTGLVGDNVTFAQNLNFDIHKPEAAYRVYRNGVLISGLYETDPVFTAFDQPEGTWDFTATALDSAGNESVPSQSRHIIIDRTPPAVTGMTFNRDPAGQSIRMVFSEDVSTSITAGSLILTSTGGLSIPDAAIALAYDATTHTAIFTFPGLPRGLLPDGTYTVSLGGTAITDRAGNGLALSPIWQISQLRGDINQDGIVDRADFAILVAHMGQLDPTGDLGDLNGDRQVGFVDFQVFERAFGKTL